MPPHVVLHAVVWRMLQRCSRPLLAVIELLKHVEAVGHGVGGPEVVRVGRYCSPAERLRDVVLTDFLVAERCHALHVAKQWGVFWPRVQCVGPTACHLLGGAEIKQGELCQLGCEQIMRGCCQSLLPMFCGASSLVARPGQDGRQVGFLERAEHWTTLGVVGRFGMHLSKLKTATGQQSQVPVAKLAAR